VRTAAALLFASLCAVAAAVGAGAHPERALVYRASATGSIRENWSYTRSTGTPGCTRVTRSAGRRVVRFRTATPARVGLTGAARPELPARLTPTPITSIEGTLQHRPGRATTSSTCGPKKVVDCEPTAASFDHGVLRVATRKDGRVVLGRIRHSLLTDPLRGCGAVVYARTGDVDLVEGKAIPTRLLGRGTIEISATYTSTTPLGGRGFASGSLVTKVDWELRLVRTG
jgi:hypothetical protein